MTTAPNIKHAQFIALQTSLFECRPEEKGETYAGFGFGAAGKNKKSANRLSQPKATRLIQRPHLPKSNRDGGSFSPRNRLPTRVAMQNM